MSHPPESGSTGFTSSSRDPREQIDAAADSANPGAVNVESALAELSRLGLKEDGSGCIERELLEFLDGLGDAAFTVPELRIAGQVLLGKVLTGLGEDEQVAQMIVRNINDSVVQRPEHQRRAAEVVAIRLLRVVVRMEALELRGLVLSQFETPGITEELRLALELTADLLDAEALDKHPDEVVQVFLDYADRIMLSADSELVDYFNALDKWVHVRKRDCRMDESSARADGS